MCARSNPRPGSTAPARFAVGLIPAAAGAYRATRDDPRGLVVPFRRRQARALLVAEAACSAGCLPTQADLRALTDAPSARRDPPRCAARGWRSLLIPPHQ